MNSARKNKIKDNAFQYVGIFCTFFGIVILAIFLIDIVNKGIGRIDIDFLTDYPARKAKNAGIKSPLAGTLWVMGLTAVFAIPIGIGAGLYLEEFSKKNRLSRILEVNITNLAGVPSIIYGLLGLEVFGRLMGLQNSLLAGSLTLALLILPVIIVATREAVKAVPNSIREASFAMGATKWQTVYLQVLPASAGGIITGIILSLSRAIGETAPLIVIGALTYVTFVPSSPNDQFSVLPIQIYNWVSRPQKEFMINAAAAIIILLAITFVLNGFALYLRNRWQKKVKW